MGFWDWATTAREKVQNSPVGTAANYAFNPKYDPGLAAPIALGQGIYQHASDMMNQPQPVPLGPRGLQYAQSPAGQKSLNQSGYTLDPNTGALVQMSPMQQAAALTKAGDNPYDPATSSTTGATGQWNPLAVNMFYSTAIAPLLQQLAGKFQTTDANLLQMAQNAPGQQYIPQQYQALAKQNLAQMGLDANNVSQSMLGAALTGPVIDSLQNQMSTLSQRALQSYTEALRQGASTSLNSILGPGATTGSTGTTGTTNPTTAQNINDLINALSQPQQPGG